MTDHTTKNDDALDRIASDIRSEKIDDVSERLATERVWAQISGGLAEHRPLASCDDFQAEIPAYVAGSLSEARALLVGDHTRECVPCRRALMDHRSGEIDSVKQPTLSSRKRMPVTWLRVAAAALVILSGFGAVRLVGFLSADSKLRASVEAVDGSLQIVEEHTGLALAAGDVIRARQTVRTANGSGALIRLTDGSVIEMDERSELQLRASQRGTTIDLNRGNIVVHAAKQHEGRLFVDTNDCRVAVKGTVFTVNHGLKGSRISVFEGEVEVWDGNNESVLLPGDQVTTNKRLRHVPLEEEIAWSRDAEKHRALLHELTELRKAMVEVIDNAPPRTSTFLLDLAPADTMVYASMPNISEDLDAARTAFEARLASSTVLAEWWQDNVVANGVDVEIDSLLDKLQPIGEAIGAEAVVAVSRTVLQGRGAPLFMAELDDSQSFLAELEALVEEANSEAGETVVAIVDDPLSATDSGAEVTFWVSNRLFAAANGLEPLQALAQRVADPAARGFIGTDIHSRLTAVYAGGVSWLMGVDLADALAEAVQQAPPETGAVMEQLGLLDATTVIIERHKDGDWYATNAEILFSGPRRGMMAWLAEPAAMASLDFVSPDAYVAAAVVTVDAADMFDDLFNVLADQNRDAFTDFLTFQTLINIDLRSDIAATLGGEAAFALDGPMLPVPSWKVVVEVLDAETLFQTIEKAVTQANLAIAAGDPELAPVEISSSTVGGTTFYTLSRSGLKGSIVFAAHNGYLILGPSQAVVNQSIDYQKSGSSLPMSSAFQALLPDNGYTDCSALVYRDLDSLMDAIPDEMLSQFDIAGTLGEDFSTGLVCVFGSEDRVTATATGGSLIGLGSVLGLHTAMSLDHLEEEISSEPTDEAEAVSSLG